MINNLSEDEFLMLIVFLSLIMVYTFWRMIYQFTPER